jgi:hypothetical protein
MTTALVTCFEIGREPSDVAIKMVGRPEDLAELEGGEIVPTSLMAREKRWSHIFRGAGHSVHGTQISGDIARVHRGFVTGSNELFLMTREMAEGRGLPDLVTPAITSASEILRSNGLIRDTLDLRVVLDLPADFDRTKHAAVHADLEEGERKGFDKRYITTHRRPWWRVGVPKPAPIVASCMARRVPMFARNPDGVALLNIGHGIYPRFEMSAAQLDALVAALNAGAPSFAGAGRTYHGGLEKLEPSEMEALPVSFVLVAD